MLKSNFKWLAKDVITNIIAFMVLISSQQLIALPLVAKDVSVNEFGKILTLFAVANIISAVFGSDIGNVRLVMREKYKELGESGDFKIIFLIAITFCSIVILFFSIYFIGVNEFINITLFMFFCILSTLRFYSIAEYRERKEFNKILKQNIFFFIGMISALPLYFMFKNWIILFIMAEIIAFIYSSRHILIFREPLRTTSLLKLTVKKSIQLGTNTGLTYSLSYIDRLIINPIIGAQGVSIYYASSFVSKIGNIVLNPLSGVMLGWLSNTKQKHRKKIFKLISILSIVIGGIYFIVSLIISPLVIKLLYPQFYQEALKIYIYTCIMGAIYASTSLLKPVIIRFCSIKLLTYANFLYGLIFVVLGFYMTKIHGIIGFAISGIISSIFLFILLHFIMFMDRKLNETG